MQGVNARRLQTGVDVERRREPAIANINFVLLPRLRSTATSTAAIRQNVADKVGDRHRLRLMVYIATNTPSHPRVSATCREARSHPQELNDRVLLSGFYIVPLFYAREQWIAYSNKLAHPKYIPLFGVTIDNWWQKQP